MARPSLVKTTIRWPPKAVFFDLDGTLVDSSGDILNAFSAAFTALGEPEPKREELLSVIGLRLEDCFARFLGASEERSAEGARQFRKYYRAHYLDKTCPYLGIPKAVRELSARHQLAVATMKKGEFARAIVRAFGWLGTFVRVIGAEEGYPPKPDPTMLQALCRTLDIRPDEAVYVGDTSLDVRMAAAAKVPVFFAAYGYGTLGEEEREVVNGIVENSNDLLKILVESWAPFVRDEGPARPPEPEVTARRPSLKKSEPKSRTSRPPQRPRRPRA
jgi:phosphoglycolate phosphatase